VTKQGAFSAYLHFVPCLRPAKEEYAQSDAAKSPPPLANPLLPADVFPDAPYRFCSKNFTTPSQKDRPLETVHSLGLEISRLLGSPPTDLFKRIAVKAVQ
jgi:hypothetical protein